MVSIYTNPRDEMSGDPRHFDWSCLLCHVGKEFVVKAFFSIDGTNHTTQFAGLVK